MTSSAPTLQELLSHRVILVTGKGGVGRTTCTAALALTAARAGKRVMVAEIQEPTRQTWSPLARLFEESLLPSDSTPLAEGLWGVMLDSRKGTEAFLGSVFNVKALARLAMRTPPLLRFLDAAPSFHEMGIFYHVMEILRAQDHEGAHLYDLLVVDMPATGHTLALTGLPRVLLSLVNRGPMARALREGNQVLKDPAQTTALVVTIPEPLPVSETMELVDGLRASTVAVGGVVVNRIPRDPFTPQERLALADILPREPIAGRVEVDRISRARDSLDRLERGLDFPMIFVDEQPESDASSVLRGMASQLGGLLGGTS